MVVGNPSDPSLHWDGQQWLRWDGAQWIPQPGAVPAVPQPYPAPAPMYAPGPVHPQFASDRSSKNVQATIAWIATVITLGYMLPWAIAATRGKSNAGAIGLLNFFVGWTVIGWIAALVMACSAHQIAAVAPSVTVFQGVAVHPYPQSPAPAYPVHQPTPSAWPAGPAQVIEAPPAPPVT